MFFLFLLLSSRTSHISTSIMYKITDGSLVSMELEDDWKTEKKKGKERKTPPPSPDVRSLSESETEEENTIPYSPFNSPATPPALGVVDWLDVKKDPLRFRDSGKFSLEIRTMDVNPVAAMEYFYPLFQTEDINGHIILTSKSAYGDEWIHFNFTGVCPIHRKDHMGDYNDWRYTLRKGKYAGWKCWVDNSWRTTYKFEDLDLLCNI